MEEKKQICRLALLYTHQHACASVCLCLCCVLVLKGMMTALDTVQWKGVFVNMHIYAFRNVHFLWTIRFLYSSLIFYFTYSLYITLTAPSQLFLYSFSFFSFYSQCQSSICRVLSCGNLLNCSMFLVGMRASSTPA